MNPFRRENHNETVRSIWETTRLFEDAFEPRKYKEIILPFTALRRIDSVLAPTKEEVLETYHKHKRELDNMEQLLRKEAGYAFFNTSNYTFERLLEEDPSQLASNLRTYISGFSANIREVMEKFGFRDMIEKLEQAGLLHEVMERFNNVDLHLDTISSGEMGIVFEELIRKFNKYFDENPGKHFTPPDVVRLMTELVLAGKKDQTEQIGDVNTVYDPCCRTGRMLTTTRDRIHELKGDADTELYGQETDPKTYATCKAHLYLKNEDGEDAGRMAFGSTLSDDAHRGKQFDYQLTNPPFGKDWKGDEKEVKQEASRGADGRFEARTPQVSDGQLLFLQHMISHMKPAREGGGRVSIVTNEAPLSSGDAGSGESEIRRWLLENDWVETIIRLPKHLFYNTDVTTYVWIVSNAKDEEREGKVQLIDTSGFDSDLWEPLAISRGHKWLYIAEGKGIASNQLAEIIQLYENFGPARENEEADDRVQVFDVEDFGYRKIRVERPLRVNLRPSEGRIENVWDRNHFGQLDEDLQEVVVALLCEMEDRVWNDYTAFRAHLKEKLDAHDISIRAETQTDILKALSEKDSDAKPARDSRNQLISDTDLRDFERVPLKKDVFDYFERKVKPHVEDAFIDGGYIDEADEQVGRVGYEINFNRYFYE